MTMGLAPDTAPTRAPCPDEETVIEYIQGLLDESAGARFEQHLDGCRACQKLLAALVHGPASLLRDDSSEGDDPSAHLHTLPAPPDLPEHLRQGVMVNRYVVLSKIGAGGMGVVYAAYDPELDRKIALKLLVPGTRGSTGSHDGKTRLLREAQALAKLNHPRVVAIYDVGAVGERVWMAMEFVEGETLKEWATRPRSWRESVAVIQRAGEGLAAAHAAGLLHRDFKPSNVMVRTDGEVRVMDFGLARARGEGVPPALAELDTAPQPEVSALNLQLTRAGELMGTPAYMAPEQFQGRTSTQATDQFALCVTLWELLYGERPYHGATLLELASVVAAGKRKPVPRGRDAPAWLKRVCERGLSVEPADRFPSVEALLDALDAGQRRARLRRIFAITGALLIIVISAIGYRHYRAARQLQACRDAGAEIESTWGARERARVRAALGASRVSYARATAEKVMPWLDGQARAWSAAREEACMNARVHARWRGDTLDRALWCLDTRRLELEALIVELSRADDSVVERAVSAAAGLSPVAPCRDEGSLQRMSVLPPDGREALQSVQAQLSRAHSLELAGEYERGLQDAERALTDAQRVGWRPLVAAARARVGSLLSKQGDYEAAAGSLRAAYVEARESSASEIAAAAATALVFTQGYKQARHEDGFMWGRLAGVELDALDAAESDLRRATLRNYLASVHRDAGAHDEAKRLYQQAASTRERTLGAEHPDVAKSLTGLANVHLAAGEYDDAERLYQRAAAIWESTLGAEHPNVAISLNNLANLHYSTGAYGQAKPLYARATAIWERALGPAHPHVAAGLTGRALVHNAMGEHERATPLFERVIAIRERAYGEHHPEVARGLNNLATAREAAGAHEQAKALYERALAIFERAYGPEHPTVATSLKSLADVHRALGSRAAARQLYERALAIRERALGAEHPDTAAALLRLAELDRLEGALESARARYQQSLTSFEAALGPEHRNVADALVGLAELALADQHFARARELAERALRIQAGRRGAEQLVANSRFLLARALTGAGQPPPKALTLAREASEYYRDARPEDVALGEIESWLARAGSSAQ